MRRLLFVFVATLSCGLVLAQPEAAAQNTSSSPATEDNSDSVAVIIANRNYREAGVVPVEYAHNDGQAIKSWLIGGLGFREQNIVVRQDATLADFFRLFGRGDRLQGELLNRIKRGKSNVFVFYSGHGAPDVSQFQSGDLSAYLIPVDVSPERASEGYARDDMMRSLDVVREAIGPQRWLVVMLDACFSGNSAGGPIIRASGTYTPKALDAMNGVIRVTAARRDQIANWDDKLKLGLLTGRFLLGASGELDEREGVERQNGLIPWASLANYTTQEVRTVSRVIFKRNQDPEIDRADILMRPFTVPQIAPAILNLKDESAWRRAEAGNNQTAYEEYILQCSTRGSPCRFKVTALERIKDFQQQVTAARDTKLYRESPSDVYLSECVRLNTGCGFRDVIPRTTPKPPEPAAPDQDAKLWEAAKLLNTIAAFEAYLTQFPSGFYAGMAKAAIAEFRRVQPPPPPPTITARAPTDTAVSARRNEYYYVTGLDPNGWNWLSFRTGPSAQHPWSPTIQLGPDTPLKKLAQDGDYYQVQLRSGEVGWVGSKFVNCCRDEPDRATYSYVTNMCLTCSDPSVRLRSSPDAFGGATQLKAGALLTKISERGEWAQVRLRSGETGWIPSRNVGCCR
jgi:hypothetical protein